MAGFYYVPFDGTYLARSVAPKDLIPIWARVFPRPEFNSFCHA
ncbi:MAG: hypothetical protein ACI4OR_02850 [Alphaproteobacteria bacterium]